MSRERALAQLQREGWGDRVRFLDTNTATVELAAQALGCAPERIAKTLALSTPEGPLLVIAAGDVEVEVGHAPGGVCPFGVKEGVRTYCDESLKRFDTVYPACGDDQSAVRFAPEELFVAAHALGWVDVTQLRQAKAA